jgi:nickel-dependent lactate racemase
VSGSESITLLYGRGQLDLRLPRHAQVTLIEKGKLKKIGDPAAAVRHVLSEPINSPSLNELARGRKSACILICDITRPVPNHLFLRPMVETLVASGIPLNGIIILVATGLHRPNLGEELSELVGDWWDHGERPG